jgi:hypothetical protein
LVFAWIFSAHLEMVSPVSLGTGGKRGRVS